jgi:signal transduction histidine kinase/tetratricopeptide (TPR) repeat protein
MPRATFEYGVPKKGGHLTLAADSIVVLEKVCRLKFHFAGLVLLMVLGASRISPAFAQPEGTLSERLMSVDDKEKIAMLRNMADSLRFIDPEQSIELLDMAERLAAMNSFDLERGDVLIEMSRLHWYTGRYVTSFEYSRKALDLFSSISDTLGIANAHLGVGLGYAELGLLALSTEYLIEGLRFYEALKDTHGVVSIYVNLASNYNSRKQFDLGRMYLEQARKMADPKDHEQYIDVLINLADLFRVVSDTRKAEKTFEEALQLAIEHGYDPAIVWTKTELASIALANGELSEAEAYLDGITDLCERLGDNKTMVRILLLKSEIAESKGRTTEAMNLLELAYQGARSRGYGTELPTIVKKKSDLSLKAGNEREALKWLQVYIHLKDSLEAATKDDKLGTLALIYETEKRDLEIEKLKQEQIAFESNAQRDRLIIFLVLILTLFLVAFALSRMRALFIRKRANSLLEAQREKLHKANVQLTEEKRIAENASRAKSEFLATMTHELRTPLNAVLGLTELIDKTNQNPELEDMLRDLKFSGDNLLNLINNILDFKSFERGLIDLRHEPVNLKDLQNQVVRSCAALVRDKPIKVKLFFDENVPECVLADRLRLTQILTNLLGNSAKFTETGSIELRIECIEEKDNPDFKQIRFVVSDTGIGIPPDMVDEIFKSFKQAEGGQYSKMGGTGLGLSIVKLLTELMDGTVGVVSIPGKGSSFSVTLPLEIADAEHTEDATQKSRPAGQLPPREHPVRVLVVDDNEINLFVAGKIIEQAGLVALRADSGSKAIEICKNEALDIVLMDLQMPGMDGIETALEIRKFKPELPIVALTAGEKDDFYMKNHGDSIFSDFLRKPFESTILLEIITRKAIPEAIQNR